MNFRVLSTVLSLAALQWAGGASGQDAKLPPLTATPEEVRDSVRETERRLAAQFKEFQTNVAKLQQRLSKSSKREDQDRARVLEKVIVQAQYPIITAKFARLHQILEDKEFGSIGTVREAADISQDLSKRFADLVALYNSRGTSAEEEIKNLKQILKAIDKAIEAEKNARAVTERGKTDPAETAKIQRDVTRQVQDIARALDKKYSDLRKPKIAVRWLALPPALTEQDILAKAAAGDLQTTLKSAAAVRKLVGREAAKALTKGVDFDEQMILLVCWETGGPLEGTLGYEVLGTEQEPRINFYTQAPDPDLLWKLRRGSRGKALFRHADFFVIPRNVVVTHEYGERPFPR